MCTFVPDDLFVIGPDPRIEGLYWVEGLGCQRITFAPVIGSLVADWIADAGSDNPVAELLSRTG